MNPTAIEFYYDPVSPYTYLASTQIKALAARAGAEIVWKPMLLGKVFEAAGNRMPAAVPAKGRYLFQDIKLWARHYGVPLTMPTVFPANSLIAQRVACALSAAQLPDFACAMMKAYWAEGLDISQPEVVVAVANSLGLDGAALLAAAQAPEAKDKLRALTDEAVSRGVFGAPTFFVGTQMFWGNDRLPLIEDYLAGKLAT